MKTIKTLAALSVVALLTACTCNKAEELEARVAAVEGQVKTATMIAERAEDSANAANVTANNALGAANDAVEAVSRMAEKCCRK